VTARRDATATVSLMMRSMTIVWCCGCAYELRFGGESLWWLVVVQSELVKGRILCKQERSLVREAVY
jgi:hypothetical protein